ncbi:MAG: hypothetical protein MK137_00290 [Rickettsiales bacterium]|nr:hypothetical protein [Rickettsiales bacterium]
MKKIFITFLICISITSCATVLSGTSQSITLQAVDAKTNEQLEDVVCTIRDGEGLTYPIPANPGTVQVRKGRGSLTPICKKDGYKQTSFGVGDSFNAISIVNVIFWPGFIVDAVTGSIHKYPSHISVMMEKEK